MYPLPVQSRAKVQKCHPGNKNGVRLINFSRRRTKHQTERLNYYFCVGKHYTSSLVGRSPRSWGREYRGRTP